MSTDYKLGPTGEFSARNPSESDADERLRALMRANLPVEEAQWNHHLQAYLKRHTLMRILHFANLYEMIVEIPGDILDFGVQYGASTATLTNLRGMLEPFNASRNIVAFDTFEGLRGVSVKDGAAQEKGHAVPKDYDQVLTDLLRTHEQMSPLGHMTRTFVYKGDARETVDKWLEDFPGAPIALLHLDMDLYEPTVEVINKVRERLVAGSVVVLDELTARFFPGETRALMDVFGLANLKLRRSRNQPYAAWFRVE